MFNAIIALGVFSGLSTATSDAWSSHILGIERLLAMRRVWTIERTRTPNLVRIESFAAWLAESSEIAILPLPLRLQQCAEAGDFIKCDGRVA